MRAIDYLLLPLLTQGYNRKQAWGRIKPMVKTSTLWEKRMIYADNLTAYEKGVLLSIAALSTEPEIVLAGDGISEMTEEERKKFGNSDFRVAGRFGYGFCGIWKFMGRYFVL